jgi:hypothetical protein
MRFSRELLKRFFCMYARRRVRMSRNGAARSALGMHGLLRPCAQREGNLLRLHA